MTTIEKITCKTVIRPMRTTFATARGSKTCATSVIVTVTCDDGIIGIGEVPTSFVVPQETVDVIKRSIRRSQWLYGEKIDQWPSLTEKLESVFPDFHMTCSGLETAMFRAYLASIGSDEITWWGKQSKTITSDITIPFVPDIDALKPWVERAIGNGFDIYKVKVSGDVQQDAAFVRSIAEILSGSGHPYTIRLDGNQGFTCDSALRLLDELDERIELFEQPLKFDDYKGMKQLCRKAPVPIIADETVFTVEDARRVIEGGLAHGINIKIAKSGITQSRQIIKLAKKAKLKLMIGCMTETMVGLSTAIYCAMGTDAFDYIDLDSVHFLRHRKQYDDITIDGSAYHLGEQP
ncbi:MAG: mandelate racemase/muconate lactonizing enzyme family protein [Planctomycetota bacterium]|jgi:L-alanine-DL-glutamate epimerase-like enolase superfamily enzyme